MFLYPVKICCIGSVDEARRAVRYGARAVGLVSAMPSGPGVIDESLIAEIAASVPAHVLTFLLTCLQDVDAIVAQHRRCRTTTVQLCDRLERGSYDDLRAALPGVSLVQVVHVEDEASALEEARSVAPHVDALLLDSGSPQRAVKQLGGTGRVHDWRISARIRAQNNVPVYLAGGLTPQNVRQAIEQVAPFGLDVCSGVRTNGVLDECKLAALFDRLRHSS